MLASTPNVAPSRAPPPSQVMVETVTMGDEEDDVEQEEQSEDDGWGDEEDFGDLDYDDIDGGQQDSRHNNKLPHQRAARRPFARLRPRRKKKSPAAAAATVTMRHPASGTVFSWRTAGVKDTTGAELHEGASYRLVATVKDALPGAAGRAGAVGVTRCRLTLVTPDYGGSR